MQIVKYLRQFDASISSYVVFLFRHIINQNSVDKRPSQPQQQEVEDVSLQDAH